jgi:hypothetical protein
MTPKQQQDILNAALEVERAERHLFEVVDYARSSGATWQQVGDLFGFTRQAAQQRWGT